MKGFVHIHWGVLGTGFNISYLRKQEAVKYKQLSLVLFIVIIYVCDFQKGQESMISCHH